MFIGVLFTVAKTQKQTKMSIDRRMDKEGVIHIYNGILLNYKKNKIMPFAATWMDIEVIILSEVSHRKANMISLICGI